ELLVNSYSQAPRVPVARKSAENCRHVLKAATPPTRIELSIALPDGIGEGDLAGFQIQFSFGGRAEHTRTSVIEFAFPTREHDRCQTIADDVHACAAHIHQFIDPENDGDTDRSQSRGQ